MALSTVEELRDFMAKDLERVSKGETTPATANAAANLCGKILQSVKLELEYNKITGTHPNISFLGNLNKKVKGIAQDTVKLQSPLAG
jgi:hypothetical protein